jgi:hypothetical protein
MQKEHATGRTRPACTGHPPRARADRTTNCARTGSMLPGSGKTFINSALAYTARERRIVRYMPPSMLPRPSGNPMWGHRLSSANTCPPWCTRSTGRWPPSTTSRPLALKSSRLHARTKSDGVISMGPRPTKSTAALLRCARRTRMSPTSQKPEQIQPKKSSYPSQLRMQQG